MQFRRRLRLRDKVALGFALMALLLSTVLAAAAWFLVSGYVNQQREDAVMAQTVHNAELVRSRLRAGHPASTDMLNQLRYPSGAAALLVYNRRNYPSSSAQAMHLPKDLSAHVRAGAEEGRRVVIDDEQFMVVGVSLGGEGDAFFELYPLAQLEQTLRTLWVVLVLGAVGTSLLGLGIGRVASRRMLRPVADVTAAAAAIAHGDLSARLSPETEPDLSELATSFNRTAAALENRVRADARFAGDVSHELRTPLTTMLNSIALLHNRRSELPPALLEPVDLLADDLERFRQLVVDLLEISRADGGFDQVREKVLVADLVRRAADAAAGRPVTVVDASAEDAVMYADKRRLERVFANLVENAEVHGGGCTSVRVAVTGGALVVTVDDHGAGVEEDRRERIFERFARDASAGSPGVGLGLAIVARHVLWHGGEVRVEDGPDGGARFVVQLPIGSESAASSPRRDSRPTTRAGGREGRRASARLRRWRR